MYAIPDAMYVLLGCNADRKPSLRGCQSELSLLLPSQVTLCADCYDFLVVAAFAINVRAAISGQRSIADS